jgi:hypothetical protein
MTSFELQEYRRCPQCGELFEATVTVERGTDGKVRSETPCPRCGTPGERLLKFSD